MSNLVEAQSDAGIRVRIVYQMDPDGLVPSEPQTSIRAMLKAASSCIRLSVIGLTSDSMSCLTFRV